MRVDVKKYLFVGLTEDKIRFFEEAQALGVVQFIIQSPLQNGTLPLYVAALKVLRGQTPVEQEEPSSLANAPSIAQQVLDAQQEIEKAEAALRALALERARISIFGDFSLEDLAYLYGHKRIVQFFCGKKGKKEDFQETPTLLYVGTDHGLDYFVSIAAAPMVYAGLIEMKIEVPLNGLQKQALEAHKRREEGEAKLRYLMRYNRLLHEAMGVAIDQAALHSAVKGASPLVEGKVFTATGWVPNTQQQAVRLLAHKLGVHEEEIAIEPEDQLPTCLENRGMARIGEDLVAIYDTPSTTDKDPSLWVLCWFLFFFACILGDGGYGAVFFGLALYLRYKNPHIEGLKKRMLTLFTLLCVCCMGWGFMISSFFGTSPAAGHFTREVSLVTYLAAKKASYYRDLEGPTYKEWVKEYPLIRGADKGRQMLALGYKEVKGEREYGLLATLSDQILLELSLLVGIVHLFCGLARYARRSWSYWGWMVFLIGGYLYFPTYVGAPTFVNYLFHVPFEQAGHVGLQLLLVGMSGAFIASIIQNGLLGLTEVMNLIQVFADVLSYLRLYALGLSGAILAGTINQMAASMPFVLAVLLLIIGHAINMLLGVMGGVIHGLRLNFLEWYHYAFHGGGRPFRPLKRLHTTQFTYGSNNESEL